MAKKKSKIKLFLLLICVALILMHCGLSSAIFGSTIRKQLSAMFGCEVAAKGATFSLLVGRGGLDKLRILNPPDYPAGDAITLEHVEFKFQQSSFWKERVVIEELSLKEGIIHYQEVNGVSNISSILASIEEYSQTHASDQVMVIERLLIQGWKCSAKFSPDDACATEFSIPDLEIVGLKGTGAELGEQISEEIAAQIAKKLRSPGMLFQRSKNALLSTMKGIGRGSKDLVLDFIDTLTGKSRPEEGVGDNDEEETGDKDEE